MAASLGLGQGLATLGQPLTRVFRGLERGCQTGGEARPLLDPRQPGLDAGQALGVEAGALQAAGQVGRARLEVGPLRGHGRHGLLGLAQAPLLVAGLALELRLGLARGAHAPGCGEPAGQGPEGRLQALLLGAGPGQLALAPGQRLGGGAREVVLELARDELGLAPGVGRAQVGGLLHALVDLERQQRHQDLAALLGLALQEGVELPLRQHHRASEGVVIEAHDALHLGLDLGGAVGQRLGTVRAHLLQSDLGRAAHAHGARHAVALGPHLELEAHAQALGPVGDELLVLAPHARHLAEEREGQRVDERGLAGPGGAGDGEQVEAVEVEHGLLAEGRQPLDLEPHGPHRWDSS